MFPAHFDNDDFLARRFRQFVSRPDYPCLGAKSALARRHLLFVVARNIASGRDDPRIYRALVDFAKAYEARKSLFHSFVVIFRAPALLSEGAFEACLWDRLQSLTDQDVEHGQPHDGRVSADPASPHFSLSFGGEAFFAVGLHPGASRPARRFAASAIVFNLHDQFEEMRKQKLYGKMRERILTRDEALSGSVNPMLQQFGEGSEARQYSGRAVDEAWQCPFRRGQVPPAQQARETLDFPRK